jgi:hypothetical protein
MNSKLVHVIESIYATTSILSIFLSLSLDSSLCRYVSYNKNVTLALNSKGTSIKVVWLRLFRKGLILNDEF